MRPRYKKKRKKRTPYQIQKDKTWKACSKYNRLKYADKDGFSRCVTCKRKLFWKELQAGHWLDGRGNAILFVDDGIHGQCMYCNFYGGGNKINVKEEYHNYMLDTYGQERMDELLRLKNTTKSFTIEELAEIEDEYLDKLTGLDMQRGEI